MTARSTRGGRLDFSAAKFGANAPLDAFTQRDHIANNVLHCADEGMACTLIDWTSPDYTKITGLSASSARQQAADRSVDRHGHATTRYENATGIVTESGPFHLPVFDTAPYRVVVRALGASDNAGTTATFSVQVGAWSMLGDAVSGPGTAETVTFNGIAGTAPTWLTPTTSNVITLSQSNVDACMRTRDTFDDTGGLALSVDLCEVYVRVWATAIGAAKGAWHAYLYGLHVRAYVG